MPSADIANFLNVALDVQAEPYAGVHVADGVAAATDGVLLVAADWGAEFLRGEGAISPRAAAVLAALAESTYIGGIEVSGNRVTALAQSTRFEENIGEVSGEFQTVELPEFWCRQFPVARMLRVLTDAEAGWVPLAESPSVKNLRELSPKGFVALSGVYGEGDELFRPKADGDTLYYSVAQLRRGLRLFGARARLSVRRSAKGWLAFEDGYGHTFAVTPFVRYD